MGTINHDAIIVTTNRLTIAAVARAEAVRLELPCSDLVESPVNGYVSFLIAPDGSKEGWQDSDTGDVARSAWIKWARERWHHDDIHFVHVRYGELEAEHHADGSEATIVESQPDGRSEN